MKLTRWFSKVLYFFFRFFNIYLIVDNFVWLNESFTTANQLKKGTNTLIPLFIFFLFNVLSTIYNNHQT
jgi:hypothetical protein